MRSRRDFLKLLLAAPIAATVDVEKLLWVPRPMVTVPAMPIRPGHMSFQRDAYAFIMEDVSLEEMQRRYNYYRSREMELIELKPKAPYIIDMAKLARQYREGQFGRSPGSDWYMESVPPKTIRLSTDDAVWG